MDNKMKLLIAINHDGQYSIFKKLYDPKSEENEGIDLYLEECITGGEFEAEDEKYFSKIFLAEAYTVRDHSSNPEYAGTAEEIQLKIDFIKELYDASLFLGIEEQSPIPEEFNSLFIENYKDLLLGDSRNFNRGDLGN